MVRALKRIAVEIHNVAMHDCDLMQISFPSGVNYTTLSSGTHIIKYNTGCH